MNSIPIVMFSSREEAEPVQARLLKGGVVAKIQEELAVQRLWFVSKKAAGVHVEVAAGQFDQAEKLLSLLEAEGLLAHAIRCPQCKCLRVDYPQYTRNSVMTNIAAGLAAEIGLVEKDYYCEQCHYTWPKQEAHPGTPRAHMAPFYFIEDVPAASASTVRKTG